jgi:hypothetical protein
MEYWNASDAMSEEPRHDPVSKGAVARRAFSVLKCHVANEAVGYHIVKSDL